MNKYKQLQISFTGIKKGKVDLFFNDKSFFDVVHWDITAAGIAGKMHITYFHGLIFFQ